MSYIYRSNNPVEASFVETFLREKGLECHLVSSGIYGQQTYEVYASGDLDDEAKAALGSQLSDGASIEELAEESAPAQSIFYRAAIGNWIFMIVLPAVAAILAILSTQLRRSGSPQRFIFRMSCLVMLVGWCCLVRSKWDQVKKRDLMTFGISKNHPEMRFLYRLGYVVMIVGAILAILSAT